MAIENVPALIDAAFSAMPSEAAAEFYGLTLSRADLAAQSDALAAWLVRNGSGSGALVGIYMDRSLEMLVAMLGVMKAGAAYVPLDPMFPAARIRQILEETQVPVMLTLDRHVPELPVSDARVLALDTESSALTQQHGVALPRISTHDRAYVIFTSGSSGKPKGVEVTHGSVVNLLTDLVHRLDMKASDRLLAVTTISFDIAVLEILLPLVCGGTVVIAHRDDVADGPQLMELLWATRATVLQATPVTWRMLIAQGFEPPAGFKMLCGGEAWTTAMADRLIGDDSSGSRLWNMYGPTETTVWSSATEVMRGMARITIGEPIANTRFYILDDRLQPVPLGAPGELFIAGAGVARGYFRRPDLTAEKFLPDPFTPQERMYRTGDEVRQFADGAIEFLGRMDQQIKLRGFRIELGEIEVALRGIPGVRDAVAALQHDDRGETVLAAYYTGHAEITSVAVRQALRTQLPLYMVPSVLHRLASLPLTPNGKIDRRALPDLASSVSTPQADASAESALFPSAESGMRVGGAQSSVAPASSALIAEAPHGALKSWPRSEMLRIWKRLFKTDAIDENSDFFDLGGHSLLLARLQILVKDRFGVALTLADVFHHPQLGDLTGWLERELNGVAVPTPVAPDPRIVPIQPAGPGRPVFVVSQSLILRKLAFELGPEQPTYALQMLDEDVVLPLDSMNLDQLAAFHVRLIRKVQPTGPYRIAGWCVSGWTAYAIARQLEAQGETIELLMVIDAWAPGYWRRQPAMRRFAMQVVYRAQRLRWVRRRLAAIDTAERVAYVRGSIHGMIAAVAKKVTAWLHRGLHVPQIGLTEDMRLSEQQEYIASCSYEPGPLRGNILLFRSEGQPAGPLLAEDMGWSEVIGRPANVHVIPGDHREIFDLPGAGIMAARAAQVLGIAKPSVQTAGESEAMQRDVRPSRSSPVVQV